MIMSNANSNPWLGLKAYREGEVLYGRDEDIRSLSQRVLNDTDTILYGRSGVGKSSIINAGIIPAARRRGVHPIYIRLEHKEAKDYVTQIYDSLINDKIDVKKILSPQRECKLLWEFFHCNEFYNQQGERIKLLIIFDQFEEIFTLQQNTKLRLSFFQEMADFLNDVIPNAISNSKVNNNTIKEDIIFTTADNFATDLDDIDFEVEDNSNKYVFDNEIHFLFTLREDFLSEFEFHTAFIPSLRQHRYGLRPINEEQAAEIIQKPRQGLVSIEVAKLIIEKVTNRKDFNIDGVPEIDVDSAILSLYLNRLYEEKTEETITATLVEQKGGEIIETFYLNCIKDIPTDIIEHIEDCLLNEEYRRENKSLKIICKEIGKNYIDDLIECQLLRKYSTSDGYRVEFIHDILCPIIKKRKEIREAEQAIKAYEEEQNKLLAEQEEQRIIRNREYNKQKRLSSLNVLTQKGRRLLDNALDFGEFRTMSKCLGKYQADNLLYVGIIFRNTISDEMFKENEVEGGSQEIFRDPLLTDATYRMSFLKQDQRACTTDGVYAVSLKYNDNIISDINFYGRDIKNGNINYETPIYIYGGFCGIHIDYDEQNREIRRTYLGDNGNPTINIDGYSIVETEYDYHDNPVRIKFFKKDNGIQIPCPHLHGNYGFDSKFDIGGNEIERTFIDYDGKPIKIITGVCKKRLRYDEDSFQLTELNNLDGEGNLAPDFDGYVTIRMEYDDKGRQYKETYYDVNGTPWKSPNNVYGTVSVYDNNNLTAQNYYLGQNNEYINDKDGVFSITIIFNENHQVIGLKNIDKDGVFVQSTDNIAEQRWNHDSLSRLNQIKFYSASGIFQSGIWIDFNKEGTHILRIGCLNASGERILNEDYEVDAIEYDLESPDDLPILQRFVNSNNQFIPCSNGYFAVRKWNDNEDRLIKECFYDIHGHPMSNNEGIYGHAVEYVDDNTTKCINIDKSGNPMEDKDGVCVVVTTQEPDKESQYYYNINGTPAIGQGCFAFIKETIRLSDGKLVITTIHNEHKQPILFAFGWAYKEETFDKNDRLIKICYKNLEHELVIDKDGDYNLQKSYSENGLITTTTILDQNGEPCNGNNCGYCYLEEIVDEQGRMIKSIYYDVNKIPIVLNDGSFGYKYEYDENNGTKTTVYLDKNGEPADNSSGVAYREQRFDSKGRIIFQQDFNYEKKLIGTAGVKEYVDNEDRINAYYVHYMDADNIPIPNEFGAYYKYFEEDAKERILKMLYYGKSMELIADEDGDYGLEYSYDDKENSYTLTCLDNNGMPHDNQQGYSKIKRYTNDSGKNVKELYFTSTGEPFKDAKGNYGYSYEYLSDEAKITGSLDENGLIHQNNEGYAYTEEWKSLDETNRYEYYYDINKKNTVTLSDELGDYGKNYQKEEDCETVYSLDECGNYHINKKGYYAQKRNLDELGRVDCFLNLDLKQNLVADDYGDYGTIIKYSDDETIIRLISLDRHGNQHMNDYGYAYFDKIKDFAGDEFRIWYNSKGEQVLPKRSLKSIFKSKIKTIRRNLSSSNNKNVLSYNARQMGAMYTMILARQKGKGLAKKLGLTGTYLVLQFENWNMTEEVDKLEVVIKHALDNQKQLILLPIEHDGPNLTHIGECISVDFPAGKMGFHFLGWDVNQETFKIAFEALDEYSKRTSVLTT